VDQEEVTMGGLVESVKEILTRTQNKMAFVTLQDLKGTVEVVVFSDVYEKTKELLKADNTVFLKGKVDAREESRKILASDIISLQDVSKFYTQALIVDLRTVGLESENLQRLKQLLETGRGKTPVYVNFRSPDGHLTTVSTGDDLRVNVTEELFSKIEAIYGEGSVKIEVGMGPKIPERPRWQDRAKVS
jgi:DNA polymerase-3 subunit alpha